MKNIFSRITVFVLAAAVLMCFSCAQNLDFNKVNAVSGKTVVTIGSVMRSALPGNTIADLTDIVLSGKLSGTETEETEFGSWDNLVSARTVEINYGTYDFTLTGKAGAITYSGTISGKEVSGPSLQLTFELDAYLDKSALSGTGSFEVKLAFPKDSGVVKALAYLYKVVSSDSTEMEVPVLGYDGINVALTDGDGTDDISSSYYVALTTGTGLTGGQYILKWDLFAEGDIKVIDDLPEDIIIDDGKISKNVKTLLKTERTYTLAFNLNGGNWKNGYTAPSVYSRLSKPAFPSESNVADRAGYEFGGWYADSDFSGSEVTSILSSDTGNKTFYAKWNAITYTVSFENMSGAEFRYCTVPSSFNYGDEIILPRPVKEGYNFRGWYLSAEKAASDDEQLGDRIARISTKLPAANLTLYAKWEPVTKVSMVYAYDIAKITAKTGANKIPLTHVCMAFIAHETGTTDIQYRDYSSSETMSKVNAFRAAYPNTKLIGSYAGGDEGSHKCSELIADVANAADNRKVIIQNIVDFVAKYNLDGVDLDWEYFGSYDKYNPVYLEFTTELRAALDENFRDYILLTIAVQKGKSFHQNAGIKEMLCKFDFIGLMTYDCGSSQRGEYESTSETDPNGVVKYKMGTKKVPHISFNGRHKTSTWVSGESTTSGDTSDVSAVINAYAAITGADKLVAGIGYYGHAYYILPSGFEVEVPTTETDSHRDKGKKAGASKAYYATVADIADDKIVEGLATIHPAQGTTFSAADWGGNLRDGKYRWDYRQQKIAAGSTYDYAYWKQFSAGKTVTTGHFTSQDNCIAYSYFETDVNYTFTTTDGVSHTEKLYALFIYDDVTAITNKVTKYVTPVSQGGLGCGGAMAWVFEGDADNDLHGALNDAVMNKCAYPTQNWTYPTGGHGAYVPPKIVKVTGNGNSSSDRFQFTLSGFSIAQTNNLKVIIKIPEPASGSVEPLLRSADSGNAKYQPTTVSAITSGNWAGYTELTATASAKSDNGLMITLNGSFSNSVTYEAYIAEITINDEPVTLNNVGGSGVTLIDPPNN